MPISLVLASVYSHHPPFLCFSSPFFKSRESYDHDDEEDGGSDIGSAAGPAASAPQAIPVSRAVRAPPMAATPPAAAAIVTDKESHNIAIQKRTPAIMDGWLEKKGENR